MFKVITVESRHRSSESAPRNGAPRIGLTKRESDLGASSCKGRVCSPGLTVTDAPHTKPTRQRESTQVPAVQSENPRWRVGLVSMADAGWLPAPQPADTDLGRCQS